MGLIKRDSFEEKGTLLIEKKKPIIHKRPIIKTPVTETSKQVSGFSPEMEIPKAKTEAQKIIEEAMLEAENIRDEARQTGIEEGRSEVAAQIEDALETLNSAVKERKKIISDSENEILRLSIKVAEQIIRSEVSLHRDVCLNIVAEAISRISDREQIIVKVNREDAEYLKRYKDRLAGMLDGVKSFSIIEDANVEPGGCLIETSLGFVDARISTKLKAIEEAVKKTSAKEEETA